MWDKHIYASSIYDSVKHELTWSLSSSEPIHGVSIHYTPFNPVESSVKYRNPVGSDDGSLYIHIFCCSFSQSVDGILDEEEQYADQLKEYLAFADSLRLELDAAFKYWVLGYCFKPCSPKLGNGDTSRREIMKSAKYLVIDYVHVRWCVFLGLCVESTSVCSTMWNALKTTSHTKKARKIWWSVRTVDRTHMHSGLKVESIYNKKTWKCFFIWREEAVLSWSFLS